MKTIHLDTDLGGDLDDLCALAMLLRWPELHISGITVVGDTGGKRTGYTRYALKLAGREDIPVAAGAETSDGYYPYELGLPVEEDYWPEPVAASPNPVEDALALLKHSIEQGAMILGIGPYTNLYLLEQRYPGILQQATLVLMGGYIYPTRPGFPTWGNDMDFNIQVDVRSAKYVLEHSDPLLVPLSVTVETALRRAYLPDLRQAGALGALIAHQAEAFALEYQNEARFGETCAGLPRDTINFQHDPLACAIALGWMDGVEIEELPLVFEEKDGVLTERVDPAGKPLRVVTKVDGPRFNEFWLRRMMGE
jgi:purine nucleosidase